MTDLLFRFLLVFLIPLAIYCLVLALVNRRPRPLMVRGLWDCVGLLFAASGFLLVVAPGLLKMLYAKSVGEVPLDQQTYDAAVGDLIFRYWGITLFYFLFLITGIAILLWWRASTTIIYNVDAERFDAVLHQTLARLGFELSRSGNQLTISRASAPSHAIVDLSGAGGGVIVAQEAPRTPAEALLLVEPFAPMSNVTLHWFTQKQRLRDEIEDALDNNLATARLYDNPAGTWLLGIAAAIFFLIFVMAVVIVLGAYFPPPHRR